MKKVLLLFLPVIVVAVAVTAASGSTPTPTPDKPVVAPGVVRVGGSAQIGPVCFRFSNRTINGVHTGGIARFVKLSQSCYSGERRRYIKVPIRLIISKKLITGPKGDTGAKGDKGDTGAQGAQGAQGIQGIPGVAAAKGEQGEQGIPGTPGKNGVDGKNGIDGKDGLNGKDGKDGKNGVDGKDGKDGLGDGIRWICWDGLHSGFHDGGTGLKPDCNNGTKFAQKFVTQGAAIPNP